MAGFTFNGKLYEIPQAMSKIEVILNIGAPLPDFGRALIIGRNLKGPGPDASVIDSMPLYSKLSKVSDDYGIDSEIATAFKFWSLHGGEAAFTLGICKNTQTIIKIGQDKDNAVKLISKEYGAHTGDFGVSFKAVASGYELKIVPVKNLRFFTRDGSDKVICVSNIGTLQKGENIFVKQKDTDFIEASIKSIDAENGVQKITLNTVVNTYTYANQAHIFQLDKDNSDTISISDLEDFKVKMKTSKFFKFESVDGTPNLSGLTFPEDPSKPWIRKLGAGMFTEGESPVPSKKDWTSVFSKLQDHILQNKIRLINPVIADANIFEKTKSLTFLEGLIDEIKLFVIQQRKQNQPVQIFLGGSNGCDDEENQTLAKKLNNQDIIFTVGGLNKVAPAASFASAVMAMVSSSPVAHNLTRDAIQAIEVEKKYTFVNPKADEMINRGCIIALSRPNGFFIAKGINTLQANQSSYNLEGATTYLPMQRAMADFIDITLREGIDNTFVGTDGVTSGQIANYVNKTLENIASIRPTILREFKLESIERSQSQGFLVDYSVKLAEETNFIGLTMSVHVG